MGRFGFLFLIAGAVIIITFVLIIKKFVLKVDYKEYSSSDNRLERLVKKEEIEDKEDEENEED